MAKNWAQINAIRNNVNAQAELKAPIIQSPIIQNMFLPNHSGDHSAGTTKTPEKDIAIANKAYVDNFGVAHLAAYNHTLLANINQDVKTTASPSFVNVTGTGYLAGDAIYSRTATALSLKGQSVDGASAVGCIVGSYNTLSTAGAKLVSFRNATVEKAYIDKDGAMFAEVNQRVACGGGSTGATTLANGTVTISINGQSYFLLTAATA